MNIKLKLKKHGRGEEEKALITVEWKVKHMPTDFYKQCICVSIHPSSAAYPGLGRGGSWLSREA